MACPRIRLLVDGDWREVEEPVALELQTYHASPQIFTAGRLAEIRAWYAQVRYRLTMNDREFLHKHGFRAWTD